MVVANARLAAPGGRGEHDPVPRRLEETRSRPWLLIVGGLLSIGVILFLLDWQMRGWRFGSEEAPALVGPIDAADVRPEQAIRVRLVPQARDTEGRPQVQIRLRDQYWTLAYPDPSLGIIATTDAWNALVADYGQCCKAFAVAVEAIRKAEPRREIGLIEIRASFMPGAVVEFVRDSFSDAGIHQTVVVEGASVSRPGGR